MFNTRRLLCSAPCLILALWAASPTIAAPTQPLSIAVVDYPRLLSSHPAFGELKSSVRVHQLQRR